ncbi:MAG TPA: MFS transporter [Alphaproteobacteria bacterium]|nr:MFS transporter [Alphaproteobacteria bacterium]
MVLAACVLASSMVFIDGSALTVALPRLRADFGADLASVQWVLNGYVLALASLTLIGGALADVYGKARMLTAGCLLFGVASAACGLAPSATALIAARVVQGVAAAILAPSSLALIGATYPQSERNQAIGIWAAASALTTAGGPVLGGWLTESFGWPMVFWINPPLALIAVGMLMAAAPRDRRESRRFDVTGAVILAGALGLLAWALSQVGPGDAAAAASASLSGPTIAIAVGISAGGLVLYAVWERTSRHPMTPPRLAGNHAFVSLNLATLTVYGALSVMFFLLPFDLVDRRALSATDAGLAFLPFTFGVGLLSRLFGGLADRVGGRVMLITGPLGAALAYLWLALGRNASLAFGVIGPMALLGISFAVLVAPLTASVMSSVTEADEGLASGINNAASRIAQLAGVALAAGVASFAAGYVVGLAVAAMLSVAGAVTVAVMLPRPQTEPEAGPS